MARRPIWTRAKHRVGLERPRFWDPLAAQKHRGVAPALSQVARRVLLGSTIPILQVAPHAVVQPATQVSPKEKKSPIETDKQA